MKKVVFAICEGVHDVAFLYRMFTAAGFKTYNKKIAEYPKPVSDYLKKSIENSNSDLERLKLNETRQKPIPQEVLSKDDMLVLFYGVGGVDKKDIRRNMLESIADIAIPLASKRMLYPGNTLHYTLIYFLDADGIGVKAREQFIKDEIYAVTGKEVADLASGNSLISMNGLRIGCYIFARDDGSGRLEDIMIPLMQEDNEEIFQRAADFLKLKDESRLSKLEIVKIKDGEFEENYSSKKLDFDEKKSQIGIVGQLQVSGKSNAVIIKDTDYIKLKKLNDNHLCQDILNFIHSL